MMPGQNNDSQNQNQQVPMLQMMMPQANQLGQMGQMGQMSQMGQMGQMGQIPIGVPQTQQKPAISIQAQENPPVQQPPSQPQVQQPMQGFQGINPMVTSPEGLQQLLRSLTPQQNQSIMQMKGRNNEGNDASKK